MMSGLIPVSWMTLELLLHSGRSAKTSVSSHSCSNLFLRISMPAALPYEDIPSYVNINAFTFSLTIKPFVLHIDGVASSCNGLLCHHVNISWLRASLQELRICSVVSLLWHSEHVGSSFIP
ncbi:hypothetical protein PoB_000848200 [Plakobranchus ocellatus]|uniref:Secreted protein n=1 Tax=Plakobranchus ocellatus TaxID=259542 RepID=A0AAV3YGJ2_9GAST|nr:hypothetical protein PoB_000848200 [Plakobranchus ocellatus]